MQTSFEITRKEQLHFDGSLGTSLALLCLGGHRTIFVYFNTSIDMAMSIDPTVQEVTFNVCTPERYMRISLLNGLGIYGNGWYIRWLVIYQS